MDSIDFTHCFVVTQGPAAKYIDELDHCAALKETLYITIKMDMFVIVKWSHDGL